MSLESMSLMDWIGDDEVLRHTGQVMVEGDGDGDGDGDDHNWMTHCRHMTWLHTNVRGM